MIAECQESAPFPNQVQAIKGYEDLLADPEIDAVYIPLPTVIRDKWAMAAIEAGKHVLIEKPCSQNLEHLKQIVAAAEVKNLQVMDGVMFVHTNRFAGLTDAIHKSNAVGEVRRIASQFSFHGGDEFISDNIRCDSRIEPFGALGDLGWYCIRMSLAAMDDAMPQSVHGRIIQSHKHPDADAAVPIEFEGTMTFEKNVTASIYCSFVTELQQWTNISGSEGNITIEDFVLPYHGRKPQFDVTKSDYIQQACNSTMNRNAETLSFAEAPNSAPDSQEAKLFREFNTCVLSGKPNPQWPQASLNTQTVMDALMQSAREQRSVTLA